MPRPKPEQEAGQVKTDKRKSTAPPKPEPRYDVPREYMESLASLYLTHLAEVLDDEEMMALVRYLSGEFGKQFRDTSETPHAS